ncbi:glycosyltransferase [Allopontixanthobacter sediminis]|uniref:Glycosyltransferase n=1 Tax=Allopontixanthobacter sediminis TaxID=1689985 RepID=A0A845B1C3_9SPHN|nr:glycosyltransferase [Allopontixanthobacter sediminis]MXP43976.1 glycosyltransferase [Allopontixanthobacter sediminis]
MNRLLSIATLFPNSHTPRFGTFVARSLEALAARGDWEVTLINPIGVPPVAFGKYRALAAAAVDGTERGVQVYRPTFPLIPRFGVRFNPALIARSVRALARRLHAESPFDLVDAQFFFPDGPAAARIASDLGLPLSIKARGSDISYWSHRQFARRAMLAAGDQAAGLLSVSDALTEDMVRLGMDRGKIVLNRTGLDRDRFRPLDHASIRRRLGEELGLRLSDDQPLLATVGALTARKGQGLVIESLPALPGVQMLLVGSGESRERLETQARSLGVADRVHFAGIVDHDLLPIILSAADAMVLPSSHEGLANAWVESLACGTPLVICDAGAAREVVTVPEAGLIVERSVSGVTEGIRQILANPPPREAVAKTAERFSWTENAASLAEYYRRLICA